jgi:NADH-quinone oxidoreductase subunit N
MNIPALTFQDFLPLLPSFVLSGGAMLLLLSEVFLSGPSRSHQAPVAIACSLIAGAFAGALAFRPAREVLQGMGVLDPFSSFLTAVICFGLTLVLLLAAGFLRSRNAERGEFYALALFAATGMSLLALSAELITLFISLEILSVATYALTAYLRRGTRPAEAGFKYFVLGAFSSAVLLYGIALLYGATGATKLALIGSALPAALADTPALVYCATALIGAGLAFKVAAVPFHMWTPDVYEGAPTPVTALMSAGVKAAAFAALLRVFWAFGRSLDPKVTGVLFALLALLSMVVGNLLAIPQRNVKRMLAYSSIAHAGYVLLGVTSLFSQLPAGEVSTSVSGAVSFPGAVRPGLAQDALRGILFYLLAYTVTVIGAFGTLSALERREDEEKGTAWDLERFSGLAQSRPAWAFAMAAFMLSLGGIPPTVGFMGKLLIFQSAVNAGLVSLAVVGVLSSAVGVYYYLRVVVYMFMRPASDEVPPPEREWTTDLALAVSTVAVFTLGIAPGLISNWLSNTSLLLGSK